jgi:hypothetical protein
MIRAGPPSATLPHDPVSPPERPPGSHRARATAPARSRTTLRARLWVIALTPVLGLLAPARLPAGAGPQTAVAAGAASAAASSSASRPASSSASAPPWGDAAFGTPWRPFAKDSLWNSRPLRPVLGPETLAATRWDPAVTASDYAVKVFVAQASDGPLTVRGPGGAGVADPEHGTAQPVLIPRWPANVQPAPGSDGHADLIDPVSGVVHSFWQLRRERGAWVATMHAWTRLDGSGWGSPAHPYQGARAAGVPSLAGLMRSHEVDDGLPLYRHALAMSLDASSLAAEPAHVFPATAADFDAARTNRGRIPQGSLLMLPPEFDVAALPHPQLRKIAETLKVYGARVVDRNHQTRFVLYAEIGSGLSLSASGWNPAVAQGLRAIADALRPLADSAGWIDGEGQHFEPRRKLDLLALRGPWTVEQGRAPGRYDSAQRALVFAAGAPTVVQRQDAAQGLSRLPSAQPQAGRRYRLAVQATGGATLQLLWREAAGPRPLPASAALGDGQQWSFTWPQDAGPPLLRAASGDTLVRGSWLKASLVEE